VKGKGAERVHAVNGKAEKRARLHGGLQSLGDSFLSALEQDQRHMLRICGALEKVADLLPASRKHAKTAKVVSLLNSAFERHVFLHERCLFPLIRSLAKPAASLEPVLTQLEFEHASDHGLVLEINAILQHSSVQEQAAEIHVLGYLLRSFFENYRRHHSWEKSVLYPLARKHLTAEIPLAQHDAILRVSLDARS
jgi:hemerythrin-like domain-containing protein